MLALFIKIKKVIFLKCEHNDCGNTEKVWLDRKVDEFAKYNDLEK